MLVNIALINRKTLNPKKVLYCINTGVNPGPAKNTENLYKSIFGFIKIVINNKKAGNVNNGDKLL